MTGVVTARTQASSKKSVVPNQNKKLGGGGSMGHPHRPFHNAVCGQTDPFCSHALGARIPDGNAGRSLAYQVRGSILVGTNAAGVGGVCFLPYFPYMVSAATGTTGTITWNNTTQNVTASTAFASSISYYRIVSWGVKIGSILAATNNSGFVTVASASSIPTTTTVPDMEFDDAIMSPLNSFKGVTWISKRLSDYNLYYSVNSSTNTFPLPFNTYTGCVVQLTGPSSTNNCLLCELVMNLEFTPLADTASALLAVKGPVKNDAVLTGASHVQSVIKSAAVDGVEEVGKTIENLVMKSPLGMIATIGTDLLKAL